MVNVKYKHYWGAPLVDEIKFHFTSGCSCKAHNDKPQSEGGRGGSKASEHVVWTLPCKMCSGNGKTRYGNPCKTCGETGLDIIEESNAVDGFFYWGDNLEDNRVDTSDVLIYAYECELINGLILYKKHRYHISTGRRYKSWKDKR